jgi:hypothetical protein
MEMVVDILVVGEEDGEPNLSFLKRIGSPLKTPKLFVI